MSLREWAKPDSVEWPLRRVIGRVNGRDLLECGHPLAANMADDHYKVLVFGRRCPDCHAESGRDSQAEIKAHREFLQLLRRQAERLDS